MAEDDAWRPLTQALDQRVLAPLPPLNAAAQAAGRALIAARTIADIYATSFPLAVAPLTQPMTSFADHFTTFGSAMLRAQLDDKGIVSHCRKVTGSRQPIAPLGAFREPLAQTVLFNQSVAGGMPWRGQLFTYRSDLMPHGVALHIDQPEAGPNDMIALAVNANPTLVVPHKATLDIIGRSPFAPVLDYRLDDPKLQSRLQTFQDVLLDKPAEELSVVGRLRRQLLEAAVELATRSLNVMTGMDIHTQAPQVEPRRVCGKFVTNFNVYRNWEQPAT